MRKPYKFLIAAVAFFAVASVLGTPSPSPKAGQPLLAGAQIDPQVLSIFRRSCKDCHSEDSYYPWYSYVAPVQWLILRDVSGGRRHLNLSQWQDYAPDRQDRLLTHIAEQVKNRDMPLWQYLIIHRNAKLSDADIDAIVRWTEQERARLNHQPPGSGLVHSPQ